MATRTELFLKEYPIVIPESFFMRNTTFRKRYDLIAMIAHVHPAFKKNILAQAPSLIEYKGGEEKAHKASRDFSDKEILALVTPETSHEALLSKMRSVIWGWTKRYYEGTIRSEENTEYLFYFNTGDTIVPIQLSWVWDNPQFPPDGAEFFPFELHEGREKGRWPKDILIFNDLLQ